jgi:hypothetical protein
MQFKSISRRQFIAAALLAMPLAVAGEAGFVEPTWLKVRHLRIGSGPPVARLVQFSDLHHKGDRDYLQAVVAKINALAPDFTCFTGDLVEDKKFLPETLAILAGLRAPVYGVPGNHDFSSRISFAPVHECFAATGGAWLLDERRVVADGKINLYGLAANRAGQWLQPAGPAAKNLLLLHYPFWVKQLADRKFDLILAGHSHGGQVRIPFYGPVVIPYGCDKYDLGLFQTQAGPLYVNAGIGYIGNYDFRFNCRPEITVIEA